MIELSRVETEAPEQNQIVSRSRGELEFAAQLNRC